MSVSLETLVAQNKVNSSAIKEKLQDIINIGKDCEEDILNSISTLLKNYDPEIQKLAIKTVAEMTKCDTKRQQYAQNHIIVSIINVASSESNPDLLKQCYRALGNLCCDCDEGRQIISECDLNIVLSTIKNIKDAATKSDEAVLYFCKFMINFTLGGRDMSQKVVEGGILDILRQVLRREVYKKDMNDDMVQSALLVMSIITDNDSERIFDSEIIMLIVEILKETMNVEISETCLDILHIQAENDGVKTQLAKEGVCHLLTTRLEVLVSHRSSAEMVADEDEVKSLIKKACELLVIILTGDESMNMIYNNGLGETYLTTVKWLNSTDYELLTTAVLAIGNFARSDSCCIQMVLNGIYDILLELFETYHGFSVRMAEEPDAIHPIDKLTLVKIQHALLSALRNLVIPVENKNFVASSGKVARVLIGALPKVDDYNVAYKLLAVIRMLVEGQVGICKQLCQSSSALGAVVRWGRAVEYAGAAGEAPRLVAWTVKNVHSVDHCRMVVQVNGCVECLVNMLVSSHSLMQNEAILSLTILALAFLEDPPTKETLKKQLVEAETGKHLAVLIETSCSKMPVEVAENLLAFLDVTIGKYNLTDEYIKAKIPEAITKLKESRKDFSDVMKACIDGVNALFLSNKES